MRDAEMLQEYVDSLEAAEKEEAAALKPIIIATQEVVNKLQARHRKLTGQDYKYFKLKE